MVGRQTAFVALVLASFGCNVASPPPGTGGANLNGTGLVVVTSDYTSTDIAISNLDGTTVSSAFVSSGSTPVGLSAAISGDVVVPMVPTRSGRVVLVDQFTAVVTWMDPKTATVLGQLPVDTGFASDPYDYVETDSTHAFITRFTTNGNAGKAAYDQGGDVLIVDTSKRAIAGRIALPEENSAVQPSPTYMTWLGSDVAVSLQRLSADYTTIADGRFVGISPTTNSIDWTVTVSKLENCGRLAISPSGALAAIACSSQLNATGAVADLTKSDIVVYDATQTPPKELKRFSLGTTLGAGIAQSIAFASENLILAETMGGMATVGDTAFSVDVNTGKTTTLATSVGAFVFGSVKCSPGAGDVCVLADADKGSSGLKRWHVANGTFTELPLVTVDTTIGLPPRYVGAL